MNDRYQDLLGFLLGYLDFYEIFTIFYLFILFFLVQNFFKIYLFF